MRGARSRQRRRHDERQRERQQRGAIASVVDEQSGYRFRRAPLPAHLRRGTLEESRAVYDPAQLGKAIGGMLRMPAELRRIATDAATAVYDPEQLGSALGDLLTEPPDVDVGHIRPTVALEKRLDALRAALSGRGSVDFDEQFGGEDRLTQAVTLFALLELYRRGEATWKQSKPFGPIEIVKR